MSGVGGLLELYWNFIGVDRNFIGTVSLRYCYVIATLLGVDRAYIAGARSTERPPLPSSSRALDSTRLDYMDRNRKLTPTARFIPLFFPLSSASSFQKTPMFLSPKAKALG